ncbi:hypothetical protein [Clostridium sp.]|uniref:hypothetical protein n=1 Tax=Clostridium sp. TaxID=1506 RepID=UPI00283AC50E|nr:hypothetical protein [Clostridium sp.]MDR3593425.1 hypothetical protein [Clostridium sp.]
MSVKRKSEIINGVKQYFYQYVSSDGKKFTKYYYLVNNDQTRIQAWLKSCNQRKAIKASNSDKDKCWFTD